MSALRHHRLGSITGSNGSRLISVPSQITVTVGKANNFTSAVPVSEPPSKENPTLCYHPNHLQLLPLCQPYDKNTDFIRDTLGNSFISHLPLPLEAPQLFRKPHRPTSAADRKTLTSTCARAPHDNQSLDLFSSQTANEFDFCQAIFS